MGKDKPWRADCDMGYDADVVQKCKRICENCPVLVQCRYWSVVTILNDGIAGGMTERERVSLRARMRRRGYGYLIRKRDRSLAS